MVSAALMAFSLLQTPSAVPQHPVRVEVVRSGEGWQLRRGGEPFWIRGVGGTFFNLDMLREMGGNSLRTWGADMLEQKLDAAHAQGLTVTIGIWLGHEQHGFDYDNPQMLQQQRETVRRFVLRYRNHPALLIWALGNEMDMTETNKPPMWRHVNELARMVEELDPNHPTMVVVAEVTQEEINQIQELAPDVDILGVNTYGGLSTLARRLREYGWTKPYIVTEFGPLGPWEMPTTDWGAHREQNAHEKAAFMLQGYRASIQDQPNCLGSYMFLWSDKVEGTPTWFGMFLPTGEPTPMVDATEEAWNNRPARSRSPQLASATFSADGQRIRPGSTLSARATATDPEGGRLVYRWTLKVDEPPRFDPLTEWESDRPELTFRGPEAAGRYRLYLAVIDPTGRATTANFPFLVEP